MSEAEQTTFFVEQPPNIQLKLTELHVNYWLWSRKDVFVDVGLLLKVPTQAFRAGGLLELKCHLQMRAQPQTLRLLDSTIMDEAVAKWLFNDAVEISTVPSNGNAAMPVVKIRRTNQDLYWMLPGTLDESDTDGASCTIKLELDSLREEELARLAEGLADFSVYTRFQYRLDAGRTQAYSVDFGILRDHLLLDARFNDVRAMPTRIARHKSFIPVMMLRVFVIHPLDFTLTLQPTRDKQYERLLEGGQAALQRYFGKIHRWWKKSLIHQWTFAQKTPNSLERGHNVVLILDSEKGFYDKVLATTVLLILAGVAWWELGYSSLQESTKSLRDGLIALVVAVLLGLVVDLLINAAKSLWARSRE